MRRGSEYNTTLPSEYMNRHIFLLMSRCNEKRLRKKNYTQVH